MLHIHYSRVNWWHYYNTNSEINTFLSILHFSLSYKFFCVKVSVSGWLNKTNNNKCTKNTQIQLRESIMYFCTAAVLTLNRLLFRSSNSSVNCNDKQRHPSVSIWLKFSYPFSDISYFRKDCIETSSSLPCFHLQFQGIRILWTI